jgi:hypothetical protein
MLILQLATFLGSDDDDDDDCINTRTGCFKTSAPPSIPAFGYTM